MLRFHSVVTALLASAFVVPLLGQGQVSSLQDALSGTRRALDVLKGMEPSLQTDPSSTVGLIISATEAPKGDDLERERRLEALRNEVNLLQMELDALLSPVLGVDGAVQSELGGREPIPRTEVRTSRTAGITTGLDESMRAMLSQASPIRTVLGGERSVESQAGHPMPVGVAQDSYSADPLRHGITCYRAGRYAEAFDLLAPLDDAKAMYWQARTLERLGRVGEAIQVMERAIAQGGEGFEQRRAETDLEFLRWKRDFLKSLPLSEGAEKAVSGEPQ